MTEAPRAIVRLVAALLLLDVSLTFLNWWPTLGVRWTGHLSVELAICVFALALAHAMARPPSPAALRALTVVWLGLVVGRYVQVTAPALWGREINLYWDLQFVPDVVAMLAAVARGWLVAVAALGIALVSAAAYATVRWAFACLDESLAVPERRRLLIGVAAGLIAIFVGQRLAPAAPQVPVFAMPVTHTYARQVQFVIEARRGSHTLPASPSFDGDLSGVTGADVLLFFVESYGAVAYERPEFAAELSTRQAMLEAEIHAGGHDVVSGFVESPTFGGSSWFAHITLLSGVSVRDPDINARLMTERRDTLPKALSRRGYRTVAMMPGLWYPWPEGAFYGFSTIYSGQQLDYKGPPFGWWAMPDQFTLAKLDDLEVNRQNRPPLFVFFPTVSTHTPFGPTAPYQSAWPRMLTDRPYDDAELAHVYDQAVDWTNLGPSYAKALNYAYETLTGYLARHRGRDFVMIVIGDHQPPALVSGEGAPWDVPVHVITSRKAILERLKAAGLRAGLTPARPSLGPMHSLLPMLLESFGPSQDPTSTRILPPPGEADSRSTAVAQPTP